MVSFDKKSGFEFATVIKNNVVMLVITNIDIKDDFVNFVVLIVQTCAGKKRAVIKNFFKGQPKFTNQMFVLSPNLPTAAAILFRCLSCQGFNLIVSRWFPLFLSQSEPICNLH